MEHVFENADSANEAISGFFKAVTEAREKFKIGQVLVGVMIEVQYDGQPTGTAMTSHRLGSQFKDEPLAAYLYGEAAADRRKMLNLLAAGKKAGNRKPTATLFDARTEDDRDE